MKKYIPKALVLVLILLHLSLLLKTFFIDSAGNIRTAVAGYGDVPLHLTQISKFAYLPFNLSEPIFLGERLSYPFTINLISGLLLKAMGDLSFAVLFPVLLLAIANIILVFHLYKKVIKSEVYSAIGIWLFFLGGGLNGIFMIASSISKGESVTSFLGRMVEKSMSTITKWDAVYPVQNVDFGSPLSLVFLHQRPFFLGFFLFLILIILLLKIRDNNRLKYILGAGLTLGILPIAHTHSFVAGAICLSSLILVSILLKERELLRSTLMVGVIAILISIPFLSYLLLDKSVFTESSNFFVLRIGWMVEPTIGSVSFPQGNMPSVFSISYLSFLWTNFGVIIPAFLVSAWIFYRKIWKKKRDNLIPLWIGVSAAFLFLTVQIIKFQPWDYDNNKILVYFHLMAIAFIVSIFKVVNKKRSVLKSLIFSIFLILGLFSGLLDQYPRILVAYEQLPTIFSSESQATAQFIRDKIKKEDIIITGTSHLNPVASLAGRDALVGYPGWLWTRGINYQNRNTELIMFYQNPSDSNLIKKYNASYVLLDNQVRTDFKAVDSKFDTSFEKVFQKGEYKLYKVN